MGGGTGGWAGQLRGTGGIGGEVGGTVGGQQCSLLKIALEGCAGLLVM